MGASRRSEESVRLWGEHLESLKMQREAVEKAGVEDKDLARFCLIFDTLALRGVEADQAARTASLIFTGNLPPMSGNGLPNLPGPRDRNPGGASA